jgi:hypothetical protein
MGGGRYLVIKCMPTLALNVRTFNTQHSTLYPLPSTLNSTPNTPDPRPHNPQPTPYVLMQVLPSNELARPAVARMPIQLRS